MDFSHKELVQRAAKWLQNTKQCPVVLYEFQAGDEIPDAIGWKRAAYDSILMECKRSRSDFLKDADKPFRSDGKGVGNYRYYFTTPGLLKKEEITEGWGLLECHDYQVRQIVKPSKRFDIGTRQRHDEMKMMYQALHRQSDNIAKINSFIAELWPLRGHINGAFAIRGETDDEFDYRAIIGCKYDDAEKLVLEKGYFLSRLETANWIPNRLKVEVSDQGIIIKVKSG
jgi:hypothetical protein